MAISMEPHIPGSKFAVSPAPNTADGNKRARRRSTDLDQGASTDTEDPASSAHRPGFTTGVPGSWQILKPARYQLPQPLTPRGLLESVPTTCKPPPVLPSSFPPDYPPPLPLWPTKETPLTTAQFKKLTAAFAHPSVTQYFPERENNATLEFIGDRTLEFIVAELLRAVEPPITINTMHVASLSVTSGLTLSYLGFFYSFQDRVEFGRLKKGGKILGPTFPLQPMIEDVFEAYVGFVYEELGYAAVKDWVKALLRPWMQPALEAGFAESERVNELRAEKEVQKDETLSAKVLGKRKDAGVEGDFETKQYIYHVVGCKAFPGGGTARAHELFLSKEKEHWEREDVKELDEDPGIHMKAWRPEV